MLANKDITLSPSGETTISKSDEGEKKDQITKATIGEGEIIIGGEEQEAEDLEGLNRDLEASQAITRDEKTGGLNYTITIDHAIVAEAMKEIVKGGKKAVEALDKMIDAATGYPKEKGAIGIREVEDPASGSSRIVPQKELEENYKKETGKDWKDLKENEQQDYLKAKQKAADEVARQIKIKEDELSKISKGMSPETYDKKTKELYALQQQMSDIHMTMPCESAKLDKYHSDVVAIREAIAKTDEYKEANKLAKAGKLTKEKAEQLYQTALEAVAKQMGTESLNMAVKLDPKLNDYGSFSKDETEVTKWVKDPVSSKWGKTTSDKGHFININQGLALTNIPLGMTTIIHEGAGHGTQYFLQGSGDGLLMPAAVEENMFNIPYYSSLNSTRYLPDSIRGKNGNPDTNHRQYYPTTPAERIRMEDQATWGYFIKMSNDILKSNTTPTSRTTAR
ncbi:hypothetical protein Dip518_000054 [Parelusimicrobium proximum]|uniref:hypothetical protein n=1 Tax=Parelusimicrobium proximum TaxID=3228953 RepID=UPI003D1688CE